MKRITIATALIAAGFAATAHADYYVGAGLHDLGDSAVYVKAGGEFTDVIDGHIFYSDTLGGLLRATGEYQFMTTDSGDDVFAIGGVSHLDYGTVSYMGHRSSLGDDTGVIAGVGYATEYEDNTLTVRGTYDTLFDGFLSVGLGFTRPLTDEIALEVDYRINTNGMTNEWGVGLRYAF